LKKRRVPLKTGEILKLIETDGWYLIATRGNHRQYKHPDKPGRVTLAGKPSDTFPGWLRPSGRSHPSTRTMVVVRAWSYLSSLRRQAMKAWPAGVPTPVMLS
jgi:predicted RNA binding protein YcfA (HicA-like mRNA interferase family)